MKKGTNAEYIAIVPMFILFASSMQVDMLAYYISSNVLCPSKEEIALNRTHFSKLSPLTHFFEQSGTGIPFLIEMQREAKITAKNGKSVVH